LLGLLGAMKKRDASTRKDAACNSRDQVSLTLDLARLITSVKQGPMSMLRFLADARLQLHIGDLHDEIQGQVLYEPPTFYKE
jgi:hypothetical protein